MHTSLKQRTADLLSGQMEEFDFFLGTNWQPVSELPAVQAESAASRCTDEEVERAGRNSSAQTLQLLQGSWRQEGRTSDFSSLGLLCGCLDCRT